MMALNKRSERKRLAQEWELRGLMRCQCGPTIPGPGTLQQGSAYSRGSTHVLAIAHTFWLSVVSTSRFWQS
jgi:hypothetical protein